MKLAYYLMKKIKINKYRLRTAQTWLYVITCKKLSVTVALVAYGAQLCNKF